MLIRSTRLIPTHSRIAYAIAAAMVAAAVLVRLSLHPLLGQTLCDVTLYPVVLMAAVLGGGRVGLFALGLGALSFALFPQGDFAPGTGRAIVDFALYFFGGGLSVLVAASLRGAVERFEVAQERLVAALEASGTGTWRWNLRTKEVEWDLALVHLFGLDAENAPRTEAEFSRFIHPDDRQYVRTTISEAVVNGVADYEFRAVLPGGAVRWMYARSRMIRDAKGTSPNLMIGACLDVTERKLAQERQTLLVHELNHRVKNTLSVVQSLALQTLRASNDLPTFREAFQARLFALSAAHNILTEELWESASMREILSAELKPFGGIDERRVIVRGEPVRLTPRQALSFGMAFHELATNAVKYGSLSASEGSIDIAWHKAASPDGKPLLMVDWVERNGPAVSEPTRRGFGSKLIERSICNELDGALNMRFNPDGLSCSFAVPLSDCGVVTAART